MWELATTITESRLKPNGGLGDFTWPKGPAKDSGPLRITATEGVPAGKPDQNCAKAEVVEFHRDKLAKCKPRRPRGGTALVAGIPRHRDLKRGHRDEEMAVVEGWSAGAICRCVPADPMLPQQRPALEVHSVGVGAGVHEPPGGTALGALADHNRAGESSRRPRNSSARNRCLDRGPPLHRRVRPLAQRPRRPWATCARWCRPRRLRPTANKRFGTSDAFRPARSDD